MAERISKKEIEQPDWFHTEFARIIDFISQHRSQAALIAGIVAFFLIFGLGWYLYRINYEKKADQLYGQARNAAQVGAPERRERDALKLYESIVAKYPRSRAALVARYRLGNLYRGIGDINRSIGWYQEFIEKSPKDSDLLVIAYKGLGYCYEVKGDFPKALASFQDALNAKAGIYFAAITYRDMARVYEEMKEPGKAIEYYRKALEKSSDPAVTIMLKRKIATLS